MPGFLRIDSPFYRAWTGAADLVIINALTLIGCLPVVTAGAALTACARITMDMVRDEDGYIVRTWWRIFRGELIRSLAWWLPTVGVLALAVWENRTVAAGAFREYDGGARGQRGETGGRLSRADRDMSGRDVRPCDPGLRSAAVQGGRDMVHGVAGARLPGIPHGSHPAQCYRPFAPRLRLSPTAEPMSSGIAGATGCMGRSARLRAALSAAWRITVKWQELAVTHDRRMPVRPDGEQGLVRLRSGDPPTGARPLVEEEYGTGRRPFCGRRGTALRPRRPVNARALPERSGECEDRRSGRPPAHPAPIDRCESHRRDHRDPRRCSASALRPMVDRPASGEGRPGGRFLFHRLRESPGAAVEYECLAVPNSYERLRY